MPYSYIKDLLCVAIATALSKESPANSIRGGADIDSMLSSLDYSSSSSLLLTMSNILECPNTDEPKPPPADTSWDVVLENNYMAEMANIMDHNGAIAEDNAQGIFMNTQSANKQQPASQGPAGSAHALAITHVSMFEAYNCIVKKYQSLSIDMGIDCDDDASINVAIASSSFYIMNGIGNYTGIYEHNTEITNMVDESYNNTLQRETNDIAREKGIDIGEKIALMIFENRKDDGFMPDNPYRVGCSYTPTNEPGTHREDIFNVGQGYEGVCAGNMTPWGMSLEENRMYRPKPPPGYDNGIAYDLNNSDYIKSLLQVKELGYDRNVPDTFPVEPGEMVPTEDECYVMANVSLSSFFSDLMCIYLLCSPSSSSSHVCTYFFSHSNKHWSANGSPHTGTPPAMYMDIARKIAIENRNTMEDNIIMFTSIAISMSNVAVNTWDAKWHYILWRPTIAIRNHPTDTVCGDECRDETWKRLGASRSNGYPGEKNFDPNFGAYTSGHAAFGCAALQTIANFFGAYDMQFAHTSPEWNGKTYDMYNRTRSCLVRRYNSLKEMMAENAASRVCNGVHFDYDGKDGCKAGMEIANHVWTNVYLPVDPSSSNREVVTATDISERIDAVLANVQIEGYIPEFCEDGTPSYPYV